MIPATAPNAPTARPSPNGRFSRRERAAPRSISAGEAAGFSRRIRRRYDPRDSAKRQNYQTTLRSRRRQFPATAPNAKTTNPQRVPVITKITFLPHRAKRGLNVFLNAKLRCNFSGGPQAKARRLPPHKCAGRASRGKIFQARFASPCWRPGKRPTGAGISQPRGSAKRDPTSERWLSNATRFGCFGGGRFAERSALACPQAKARRLPPHKCAGRASRGKIFKARFASPCWQPGKRPTGAAIHQPRGSAKRDPTSERWSAG